MPNMETEATLPPMRITMDTSRLFRPAIKFALALALTMSAHPLAASAAEPGKPPLSGQTSTAVGRPKVGLALGGGGTRGVAHLAVIRELEKNHIPIDCIAG